jgi:hypothetical protein
MALKFLRNADCSNYAAKFRVGRDNKERVSIEQNVLYVMKLNLPFVPKEASSSKFNSTI